MQWHPRSPYVVRYRRAHVFEAPRELIWAVVEQPRLFPRMWPWMKKPNLDADRIERNARLTFVIDPPFPYRMRVAAHFTEVTTNECVAADITGDLIGEARAVFSEHERGCRAEISWTVELCQRRMRVAARVARPVLVRGHDWAVDSALRGFRRELKTAG